MNGLRRKSKTMPIDGNDNLIYNDQLVELLSQSVQRGESSLRFVPELIKDIIINERWKKRIIRQVNETIHFNNFEEFVTSKPLEGLGTSVYVLKSICVNDSEAQQLIDRVVHESNVYSVKHVLLTNRANTKNQDFTGELQKGANVRKLAIQLGFKERRVRLFPADIEDTADKLIDIFEMEWTYQSGEAINELINHLSKYKKY
jgi:hypothetical protein